MLLIMIAVLLIPMRYAKAASILAEQVDGSALGIIQTSCDNLCHDVVVGSQTFTALASGTVGAIKIFASGFVTLSRYPDTNTCYLVLYDDENNTNLGVSDNHFTGNNCGNPHMFTFGGSKPHLKTGGHYRWSYVLGEQNFSTVTFKGTLTDSIDGSFNIAPLADAMFVVYASLEAPISLSQLVTDNGMATALPEGGTTTGSTIALAAVLPSPLPDQLILQAELEPSFIAFKGSPNFISLDAATGTSTLTQIVTSTMLNGGYHWHVRTIDTANNASAWVAPTDPPNGVDFFVEDPSRNALLEDRTTIYARSAQPDPCFSDETVFSCALLPSSTPYAVPGPFALSKITFDWRNDGNNNCDGYGNYGVIIASFKEPGFVLATSTDTAYLGCGRGESGSAELHFKEQTVPSRFAFSLGLFDDGLQGGSDIKVSNIAFYGAFENTADTPPNNTSTIPTSTAKEPVVIIPGILGSHLAKRSDRSEVWPNAETMLLSSSDSYLNDLTLRSDGSEFPGNELYASDIMRTVTTSIPFFSQKFYAPLIESLVASGYHEGIDLFIEPYDWRLDIASSSASLDSVLRKAISASPSGKINIIAHSMGALLMKEYATHSTDTAFIDKLILVAPPQLGAPQMFKVLQYGDDLGFHVGPLELLNPEEVKNITENMPGAYELLPSRKYAAITGGYMIDNRNGKHMTLDFDDTNNFLTTSAHQGASSKNIMLLAQADRLHAAQDDSLFPTDSTYEIAGCQDPSTISQFVLQDGGGVDIMRTSGDGTVPIASAMNLANDHRTYFSLYSENGADHIGLIRNAEPLALIDAILNNATSSLALAPLGMSTSTEDCYEGRTPTSHRETTIEVITEGPVILDAHDTQGNITNATESDIPGSTYTSIGNLSALMLPASDTYRIAAKTNATGTLTFKMRAYDTAAHLVGLATYIGIPIPASSTITTTITPANATFDTIEAPSLSLMKDGESIGTSIAPTAILSQKESEDTTPPDIIIASIPTTTEENAPITFSYLITDEGSGVATSSATLDGDTITNGTTTADLPPGVHAFRVTSVDNAGNPRIASTSFTVIANAPQSKTSTPPSAFFGQTVIQVPQSGTIPARRCRPRPTTTVSVKIKDPLQGSFISVGLPGIEPGLYAPEAHVLPVYYSPKSRRK